jgi:hypothetical protein
MSRRERRRQLEKALSWICHWQERNAEAAFFHDRSRRKKLRKAGVDLRKVLRVPAWFRISL